MKNKDQRINRRNDPEVTKPPDIVFTQEEVPVGRILGEFDLRERISQGAMGTIYKAYQANLKREVALKILDKKLCLDKEFIARFKNEAQAAANLNHPNIIQIYSIGEDNGLHYFAMELVEGRTVKAIINEKKRIPIDEALNIILQTVKALDFAREKGVIHRDIKPDNIMVTPHGLVKIADFGLAKVIKDDLNLTKTGLIIGTALYMSPEQALGRPVDHRTDIYALGASLYHMLTGHPPYEGSSVTEVIMKQIHEALPDPKLANPKIPSTLSKIIRRMMEKDTDRRYRSYRLLLHDFERAYAKVTRSGYPVSTGASAVSKKKARSSIIMVSEDLFLRALDMIRMRYKGVISIIGHLFSEAVSIILLVIILFIILFKLNPKGTEDKILQNVREWIVSIFPVNIGELTTEQNDASLPASPPKELFYSELAEFYMSDATFAPHVEYRLKSIDELNIESFIKAHKYLTAYNLLMRAQEAADPLSEHAYNIELALRGLKMLQRLKDRVIYGINISLDEYDIGITINDTIMIEPSYEKNSFNLIPWSDLRPEVMYKLVRQYIDVENAEDRFALGVFCLWNNMFQKAREEFDEAEQLDSYLSSDSDMYLRDVYYPE